MSWHGSRWVTELSMSFCFDIRIDGQNRQNGGLRGGCAA
jgi:hypothetical protein